VTFENAALARAKIHNMNITTHEFFGSVAGIMPFLTNLFGDYSGFLKTISVSGELRTSTGGCAAYSA
jgi:hypothetical protein